MLTDEQKKVASQAFDDVDDKKTGCIPNTRNMLMETAQLTGLNPTEREVDTHLSPEFGDQITKEQFLQLVSGFEWKETDEMKNQLRADFDMFDSEGNGIIEAEDLVHILTKEGRYTIHEKEAQKIVNTFEKDANGQINVENLIDRLLAPRPQIETSL